MYCVYFLFCIVFWNTEAPVVKLFVSTITKEAQKNLQLMTLLKIFQIGEMKLNSDILSTIRIKIKQSEPLNPFAVVSHLLLPNYHRKPGIYRFIAQSLMTKILELWGKAQVGLCVVIFKKLKKIAKNQLNLYPLK